MSLEENKVTVRDFFRAFNERDLEAFDRLMSPELADSFKKQIPLIDATFAGMTASVIDMVAEGDKVVARISTEAIHSGIWEDISPSGKH